jgi:hypothetical protein
VGDVLFLAETRNGKNMKKPIIVSLLIAIALCAQNFCCTVLKRYYLIFPIYQLKKFKLCLAAVYDRQNDIAAGVCYIPRLRGIYIGIALLTRQDCVRNPMRTQAGRKRSKIGVKLRVLYFLT